jgi:hypothetical protein
MRKYHGREGTDLPEGTLCPGVRYHIGRIILEKL